MEFPDSYFEDEVREGFFIPSLMKREWAAQLEVLEEVQKICERHDIRYFAEWGTLLGAIRHGGMIPWDDDLDICMFRDDYDRFRAVVDEELPEGACFIDWRWDDDSDNNIGRIINCRNAVLEGGMLKKYHGYPYVAGIDVFWIDSLPDDPEEKENFRVTLQYIYMVINKIRDHKSGKALMSEEEQNYLVEKMEQLCQVSFDRKKPVKQQMYALLEKKVASQYHDKGTEETTNLPVWINSPRYHMPKKHFEDSVSMPFEQMEVMVPAGYNELLRIKYGPNWMKPVRSGGSHSYPTYSKQQDQLRRGCNVEFLEYKFSKEEMEEAEASRLPKNTLQDKVKGFLPLFSEAHGEILNLIKSGEISQSLDVLASCQTAAIELGTLIEEKKGEGHATVSLLERYCESIFRIHTRLSELPDSSQNPKGIEEIGEELKSFENSLADSIERDLKERRQVVFIPYKTAYWETMEGVWQTMMEDEETDVYVIPAPYYYKDEFGNTKTEDPHYETDYPENVSITSYEDYSFEKGHPDMIITQYPYDDYNYALMLHPFFYAKSLKQYTEQLVYIPPLMMDEIGPGDERARETLKAFCNMPGVVHADKVIVQSEQMKQVYVELLTEFAGEDTRQIWEDKITGA